MTHGNPAALNIEGARGRARTGLGIASRTIIAALTAFMLGSAILFVAGFSRGEFVHAAAHDVRHAAGFPCH